MLALLALLPAVVASSPFLGCFSLNTAGMSPSESVDFGQAGIDMCHAANKKYTYYSLDESRAWCTDTLPDVSLLREADSSGACREGSHPLYYTFHPGSYPFRKCYSKIYLYNGPYRPEWGSGWSTGHLEAPYTDTMNLALSADSTPESCFNICRDIESTYAIWWPQGTSEIGFKCLCTSMFNGVSGDCTATAGYVHGLGGFVQPSATLPRRRNNQMRLNGAASSLCPGALHACSVPGGKGYDCLEVDSDLESCGGCLYGTPFNATANPGVDCTALPGVAEMGVTCKAGACVVHECDLGWKLKDGVCHEV